MGLLSSFLESLLGLTMPIVPEEETALRRQLEEEARHVDWLAATRREAAQEEQTMAIEPPAAKVAEVAAAEVTAAEVAVAESAAAESAAAESARLAEFGAEDPTAENATLEDVVTETGVTEAVAVEPASPEADEEPVPADEGVSTDAEPAPKPREGQKEDRS